MEPWRRQIELKAPQHGNAKRDQQKAEPEGDVGRVVQNGSLAQQARCQDTKRTEHGDETSGQRQADLEGPHNIAGR